MHGGFAARIVSRYSLKFFVLLTSRCIRSRVAMERSLTCDHVRASRWIGAVPSPDTTAIDVE